MDRTPKARLIANPNAGGSRVTAALAQVNARLRPALGDLDVVLSTGPGDASRAAADAARDGYGTLIVAGGDGTINEVLNGVASVAGALERVVFGVLPFGTGNDFARVIGVPEDVGAATEIVVARAVASVDVGSVDGKLFVNASAGGLVAEVSQAVDPSLKTFFGKLAYVIGGAGVLFEHTPLELEVTPDDGPPRRVSASLFAVCNGAFVGGGHVVAPLARIDDGLFDVCIVHAMAAPALVGVLAAISRGAHVDDPRVEYFRARTLAIASERPFEMNTDGEPFTTRACRYELLPRAARFVVGPRDPGGR